MNVLTDFSPSSRSLIVAAAIAILLLFLQAAASIVAPVLLAVFIAVVAAPPLRWMQRKGAPKWGGLALVAFVLLDIGSIFALIATGALEGFRDALPGYQERLTLLNEQFGLWLEGVGIPNSKEAVPDILDPALVGALVRLALSNVGATFGTNLLVLLAVIFMLLEAPSLWVKLKTAFRLTEESETRLRRLLGALSRYMVIKIGTSLATAFFIWLWLWFFGIDFAVLWAILAFLLNFIPYVGAVLMALVQTDLQTTLLVALGYLFANTLIGSVLEPWVMGRGLGISTLAVFLSLLLWSWVLGTIGALLSVPLTMALMIAFEVSPQTRPIAILLGPDAKRQADPELETAAAAGDMGRDPGAPPKTGQLNDRDRRRMKRSGASLGYQRRFSFSWLFRRRDPAFLN
jgi:AI-2 transport protein TqsA